MRFDFKQRGLISGMHLGEGIFGTQEALKEFHYDFLCGNGLFVEETS